MGNSRVFSTTDLISGFLQCVIDKITIPLTAVCTQDGPWEWTVMSQRFASSPGWFQSIMLRVNEGLERGNLYDLRRFLERLTRFDPKLASNKALLGAAETISLNTRSLQRAWALVLTRSKPRKKCRAPERQSAEISTWSPVALQTSTPQDGRSNTTAQLPATKRSQIRVHTPPRAHRPRNVR